jgi:hypothetical protein
MIQEEIAGNIITIITVAITRRRDGRVGVGESGRIGCEDVFSVFGQVRLERWLPDFRLPVHISPSYDLKLPTRHL